MPRRMRTHAASPLRRRTHCSVLEGNKLNDGERKKVARMAAKEKARIERAKARKGTMLQSSDENRFVQAMQAIWGTKRPARLALTSALLSTAVSVHFFISLHGFSGLALDISINSGSVFGVWLLTLVFFDITLVRTMKQAKNLRGDYKSSSFPRSFSSLLACISPAFPSAVHTRRSAL